MTKYELLTIMWHTFRTGNFIGEAGEEWACDHLNLTAAPDGQEGFDAWDSDGNRVQIKTRKFNSCVIDGIHSEDGFDYIIVPLHNSKSFLGYIKVDAEEYFNNARKRKDGSKAGWSWTPPKSRKKIIYVKEK